MDGLEEPIQNQVVISVEDPDHTYVGAQLTPRREQTSTPGEGTSKIRNMDETKLLETTEMQKTLMQFATMMQDMARYMKQRGPTSGNVELAETLLPLERGFSPTSSIEGQAP